MLIIKDSSPNKRTIFTVLWEIPIKSILIFNFIVTWIVFSFNNCFKTDVNSFRFVLVNEIFFDSCVCVEAKSVCLDNVVVSIEFNDVDSDRDEIFNNASNGSVSFISFDCVTSCLCFSFYISDIAVVMLFSLISSSCVTLFNL